MKMFFTPVPKTLVSQKHDLSLKVIIARALSVYNEYRITNSEAALNILKWLERSSRLRIPVITNVYQINEMLASVYPVSENTLCLYPDSVRCVFIRT